MTHMALSIKVIKTAGSYSLCELSVLDEGVFRWVVGYRLLDGKAEVVGNFDSKAQALAVLDRMAFPWCGAG